MSWRYRYRALFDELKQALGDKDGGIPPEILNIMARWNEQAVLEDGMHHICNTHADNSAPAEAETAVDMPAPSGMGTTGISVRMALGGCLLVVSVAPGSPADQCDGAIAPGDQILAVDGKSIEPHMTAEEIASLIVGEAGREVNLKLRRRRRKQRPPSPRRNSLQRRASRDAQP
eukprot:CAMPEP_0113710802 /NCGR_PEP_ID=MMETSP0038_2-20120614/30373_1 /TAXON_ID=2898 /ORGANISM="Cryptomonas paramecium" /LENGTH=173 /DNA_ID=CAMNT_0000636927 /DNA_START=229 /DNA_END=747 /DNA_ORIENTATION=+ /assembly_acc=CAM_ASM_000170